MTQIERLPDGRSFVDPDGEIRFVADLLPPMEQPDSTVINPVATAKRALGRHRKRRGTEPLFGSDAPRIIDAAQNAAEIALGRPLTEAELTEVARQAQHSVRGV